MKKHTNQHCTLESLEIEAGRFISMMFDYCEEELRRVRRPHPLPVTPTSTALGGIRDSQGTPTWQKPQP